MSLQTIFKDYDADVVKDEAATLDPGNVSIVWLL